MFYIALEKANCSQPNIEKSYAYIKAYILPFIKIRELSCGEIK